MDALLSALTREAIGLLYYVVPPMVGAAVEDDVVGSEIMLKPGGG